MTELKPELKAQIENEAIAITAKFKDSNDYQAGYRQGFEDGYDSGGGRYALKLQQAEEMMEKMAKELRLIEQMSDPGSYERAVYEMKSIASDSLTEYNNYKQTKDGTANG